MYSDESPYQAIYDFQELRTGSISKGNMFFQPSQIENNKTKKIYHKNWLKDLGNKDYIKSLNYILSKLNDFQGKIAIVGSSIEEKYPLGRDLDILLIGYGKKDALQFSEKTYEFFKKEYRENLKAISHNKKVNFPAILYQHRAEDPFSVAINEEKIIPGHGGINFELGIFSKKIDEYKRLIKKSSKKLIIDVITDISYKNRGIKENFNNWKVQMKKAGLEYVILNR